MPCTVDDKLLVVDEKKDENLDSCPRLWRGASEEARKRKS
jgi:hypothetical protein